MRTSTLDGFGIGLSRQWHESLPGQRQLFAEREGNQGINVHSVVTPNRELFPTGRDLPGAAESDQAILWDVE